MACIDETGHKYGILTVIKRVENDKHGKACWLCQCECGKQIIVQGSALRKGNTKSCGCRRLSAETSEIGKRYGTLIVEELIGRTEAKKLIWKCKCDCGNYIEATTGHLHSGSIKSCGHHNKASNLIDETGNKYGLLTVLEKVAPPSHRRDLTSAYWRCKCDCGNIIVTTGSSLRNGNSQSCGCIKSLGEFNISQLLINNNINFQAQYTFSDLKYKNSLKYDFAILDKENKPIRLIEFDGPQHKKGNQWYSEDAAFRDFLKNSYAKDCNIPLVRIPYSERDKITLETLLSDKFLLDMRDLKG